MKIIGISGISGAGKSELISLLAKKLNATIIAWDDFDDISTRPNDYVNWYHRGKNYSEWNYPSLANTLNKLKSGNTITHPTLNIKLLPTNLIIFDAPLGRLHKQTGCYIDIWIHITVPLDVALIRRILRDFKAKDTTKEQLLKNLEHYLNNTRPLFLDDEYKNNADFILNSMLPIEDQTTLVFQWLKIDRFADK